MKRYEKLIESFRKLKVVVVGDIVADEFVYGRTNRLSREAPVPIVLYESSKIFLGGAANVANNVSAMGATVIPVGVVGQDEAGREVMSLYRHAGAETRYIVQDRRRPTVRKTRVLAGDFSTVTQQMIRLDRGNFGDMSGPLRKTLVVMFREAVKTADCVIFSDYQEGVLCDYTRDEMLSMVCGKKRIVTADSRFKIHTFQGVHALTPNIPEISQFARKRVESEEEIIKAAASLQRKTGCRGVLIKRGSMGMAVFRRNRDLDVYKPFGSVEVADVTGAGDTVIASFSLALTSGADMSDAACLANIAGGIKVTKRGTATVSAPELMHGTEKYFGKQPQKRISKSEG